VTLVLTVHGRDTFWVVVDRRLSYGNQRSPIDTAVKMMTLETTDGVAVLAYAGLGATARQTEPSTWMANVLRGRGGLTLEQALGVLADVATKELPPHLVRTPAGSHSIVIPAFVKGVGARVYSIDNQVDRQTRKHWYRYTSHQYTSAPGSPSPPLALGGTGGMYLYDKGWQWRRHLFNLVKAHDRGRLSAHAVADELARLNMDAHANVADGSVGPNSIVLWRRRRDARKPGPGGEHQFYEGRLRAPASANIPMIGNGLDVGAIGRLMLETLQRQLADRSFDFGSEFALDKDEMNRRLAALPSDSDDRLR
jgi:hypothetical protein